MRILFITANRLGDAILSTGLLDHLIRAYPGARITVACGPVAAGVFTRMPNLARLIELEKQPFGRHWPPLWASVVRRRWDLVVDIRGSALSFLVRARRRAIMRPSSGPKILQLARVLNLAVPPMPFAWFAPEDMEAVAPLFPPSQPIIALAPTANWAPKIWPAERFADLFHTLRATHMPNAVPAVIAGPGESEAAMAQTLLDALPEAIDLRGRLSLPQIAAFLSRAGLFIGNDSGLMHLAAAAGAPTLGLFGPTNAEEYAPSGRRAAALTSPDRRMEGISVASAASAAARLIQP